MFTKLCLTWREGWVLCVKGTWRQLTCEPLEQKKHYFILSVGKTLQGKSCSVLHNDKEAVSERLNNLSTCQHFLKSHTNRAQPYERDAWLCGACTQSKEKRSVSYSRTCCFQPRLTSMGTLWKWWGICAPACAAPTSHAEVQLTSSLGLGLTALLFGSVFFICLFTNLVSHFFSGIGESNPGSLHMHRSV